MVMPMLLIGWAACAVVRHRERLQAEIEHTERIFAELQMPTTTRRCEVRMGEKFDIITEEPGWPKRLGELDGLERGCDIIELLDREKLVPPRIEGDPFGPDTAIYWLQWRFRYSGRWIAVAVLGDDTRVWRKNFHVVAKRKNF